jgi:hypothetical protein
MTIPTLNAEASLKSTSSSYRPASNWTASGPTVVPQQAISALVADCEGCTLLPGGVVVCKKCKIAS